MQDDGEQETLVLALSSIRKQLLPYLKDDEVVKGLGKFVLCDLLEDVRELLHSKQAEVCLSSPGNIGTTILTHIRVPSGGDMPTGRAGS